MPVDLSAFDCSCIGICLVSFLVYLLLHLYGG